MVPLSEWIFWSFWFCSFSCDALENFWGQCICVPKMFPNRADNLRKKDGFSFKERGSRITFTSLPRILKSEKHYSIWTALGHSALHKNVESEIARSTCEKLFQWSQLRCRYCAYIALTGVYLVYAVNQSVMGVVRGSIPCKMRVKNEREHSWNPVFQHISLVETLKLKNPEDVVGAKR